MWPTPRALAATKEPPLAKASDMEFTAEYSTDRLMLGDILFAQVTIKNKTDHAVRISDFHPLVIRARTPTATQIAYGFGEYPGGTTLSVLAAGKEIVLSVVLDMFSDDGYEDGTFDPFDRLLEGQKVTLEVTSSTIMPHLQKLDYREYVMRHTRVIAFGAPVISRQAFDEAVTEKVESDALTRIAVRLHSGQLSYLFTRAEDLRRYVGNPRTYAATTHVLSERLPVNSSARRSASLALAVGRFANAGDSSAEEAAISSLLALLDECPRIERAYWEREIVDRVSYEPFQRQGHLSKRKADLLVSRMKDAGN
ncbi:hypothetical protein CKO51_08690 [Rhodopirellula sp. SM50]|nr:hypothetical protein CKO51_08690 [Rhodopirellula sp. SM50]